MKKYLLAIALLMPLIVRAYDFSAVAPTGQTLYFNVIDGGVEVVYPGTAASTWGAYTMPAGALTIPATVANGSTTYAVKRVAVKAFFRTEITSLTIMDGVTDLASNSFGSCALLTQITLPASLTSVGSSAFAHATALADVYMQGATPPASTNVYAFNGAALSTCTLHLPCGGLANYSAAPWNAFGSVVADDCSATITLAASDPLRGSVTGAGTYTTGTAVTLTATPVAPFRFACWNDGDTLNPRILNLVQDTALTAIFQLPVRDTLVLRDTVTLRDTVRLRDTMVVFHVDTLLLHDTAYVHDIVYVHDTVTLRDTLYLHGTDTLYRTDTVLLQPTFYRLQVLSDQPGAGVGIGSALLPAGTEAEVGALPMEGFQFYAWDDGNTDNPRRITLTAATTLTARFSQQAVHTPSDPDWSLACEGRTLLVSCQPGSLVRVYDLEGRLVSTLSALASPTRIRLEAAGAYIVQVGDQAGRKIVIH